MRNQTWTRTKGNLADDQDYANHTRVCIFSIDCAGKHRVRYAQERQLHHHILFEQQDQLFALRLLHVGVGTQDVLPLMQHDWIPSTLGHGNLLCRRCWATDLEAAAIGLSACPGARQVDQQHSRMACDQGDDPPAYKK